MDFRSIRAVVVDQNAESQPEADCCFEVPNRHEETAVAGAEHRQLARIGDRKADRGSEAETHRLE